jgi:hypothetical protein
MDIELRKWFLTELAANVPILEIFGEGTLGALGVSGCTKEAAIEAQGCR